MILWFFQITIYNVYKNSAEITQNAFSLHITDNFNDNDNDNDGNDNNNVVRQNWFVV